MEQAGELDLPSGHPTPEGLLWWVEHDGGAGTNKQCRRHGIVSGEIDACSLRIAYPAVVDFHAG
ncbi:hypothetical protein [Vibrio vulnificus YJ016]|uniref:Uncharacterized protein n=1 Tax=Vibrio vulnificus (strain YJ016) TaxID=196600 RepID=Q7MC99_VIBVY|nr:hypothetical protein [Vibrio vulnificus YJ016]